MVSGERPSQQNPQVEAAIAALRQGNPDAVRNLGQEYAARNDTAALQELLDQLGRVTDPAVLDTVYDLTDALEALIENPTEAEPARPPATLPADLGPQAQAKITADTFLQQQQQTQQEQAASPEPAGNIEATQLDRYQKRAMNLLARLKRARISPARAQEELDSMRNGAARAWTAWKQESRTAADATFDLVQQEIDRRLEIERTSPESTRRASMTYVEALTSLDEFENELDLDLRILGRDSLIDELRTIRTNLRRVIRGWTEEEQNNILETLDRIDNRLGTVPAVRMSPETPAVTPEAVPTSIDVPPINQERLLELKTRINDLSAEIRNLERDARTVDFLNYEDIYTGYNQTYEELSDIALEALQNDNLEISALAERMRDGAQMALVRESLEGEVKQVYEFIEAIEVRFINYEELLNGSDDGQGNVVEGIIDLVQKKTTDKSTISRINRVLEQLQVTQQNLRDVLNGQYPTIEVGKLNLSEDVIRTLLEHAERLQQQYEQLLIQIWEDTRQSDHQEANQAISQLESLLQNPAIDTAAADPRNNLELIADYTSRLNDAIHALEQVTTTYEEEFLVDHIENNYFNPARDELRRAEGLVVTIWERDRNRLTEHNGVATLVELEQLVNDHADLLTNQTALNGLNDQELETIIANLTQAEGLVAEAINNLPQAVRNQILQNHHQSQEYRNHDVLRVFLQGTLDARKQAEAAKQQKEHDEFEHRAHQNAVHVAVGFFEGGMAADYLPNYEHYEWLKEKPEKLAAAIFQYIRDKAMYPATTHNEYFIKLNIFAHHFEINNNGVTLPQLLEAFGNLGLLRPEHAALYKELAGQLGVDFGRINQIFALGNEVHSRLKDGDSLLSWLNKDKAAVLDGENFKRMFAIGNVYMHEVNLTSWGKELYWAMQLYMFQNEPSYYPIAVQSEAGDKGEQVFSRNVQIKSPVTHFPTAIPSGGNSLVSTFFKRVMVHRLAQGEIAPWERDPRWNRLPGETLGQLAERRLRLGRIHYIRELYGNPTWDDAEKAPSDSQIGADSFYNRALKYINYSDKTALSPTEKEGMDAISGAYFPEQMSVLLGEYFLLFAKAEGLALTGKTQTTPSGKVLPEISSRKGPTSEVSIVRNWYPGMYTRKLLADQGGGYGSPGPRVTKDKWFNFLQTFTDKYHFLPTEEDLNGAFADEMSGASLRDWFLLAEDQKQFLSLPFNRIIEQEQGNARWNKSFDVGEYNSQVVMGKGLGVTWHNVVRAEPGTEGAVVAFNPEVARTVAKLARNGYYLMEQDYGSAQVFSDEGYADFIVAEKWYIEEHKKGNKPAMPGTIVGSFGGENRTVTMTPKLWSQVKELSRKPTDQHQIFDGTPSGDLSNINSTQVARYRMRAYQVMWIPPENYSNMNEFERTVLRESAGDESRIFIKLYVGNVLIGDMSRADASAMDSKDVRALMQLLSYRYYLNTQPPEILKPIMQFLIGRPLDAKDYEGVGFFTPKEAEALLKEARVPQGAILEWNAMLAGLQKLGA